jgi:NAD(P)-dependent dehydrogenase (short-subunit alcohol dehydrogenase family)
MQLFGAFFCARAAARAFIKLNIKGAIVFTASMASYRPNKVRILQYYTPDVDLELYS